MKKAFVLLALIFAGCAQKQAAPVKVHYEIPIGGVVAVCQEGRGAEVVTLKKCVLIRDGIPVGTIDAIYHAVNFLIVVDQPEQK